MMKPGEKAKCVAWRLVGGLRSARVACAPVMVALAVGSSCGVVPVAEDVDAEGTVQPAIEPLPAEVLNPGADVNAPSADGGGQTVGASDLASEPIAAGDTHLSMPSSSTSSSFPSTSAPIATQTTGANGGSGPFAHDLTDSIANPSGAAPLGTQFLATGFSDVSTGGFGSFGLDPFLFGSTGDADLLSLLLDGLVLDVFMPAPPLDGSFTFLELLCLDTGLSDSYCRSRYGQ